MTKMKVLLLAAILAAAGYIQANDCDELYERHVASDMKLDYQSFDQTPGMGFRVLAAAGCASQAADLIEAYIEKNNATQRSLVWHVAQLRGETGDIDAAIRAAEQSIDAEESPDSVFKWNAHVNAYLAILRQDKAAFDRHLATLEAASEQHGGNAINAGLWRRLEPNFELGYQRAMQVAFSTNQY